MSNEKRESFIFYESFFQAIDKMDIADQLPIYRAITEYALYHIEPDFAGMGAIVWALIKPQLDANWKRYSDGCKGAEAGKRGGRPKKKNSSGDSSENPTGVILKTPNVNDNVNDNNNENIGGIKRTAKRFTSPSFDEVSEYITAMGYNINPQSFIDFYESNGWRVGKNPMKNWKAALSSWNSRDDGGRASTLQTPQKAQQYDEL